MLFYVARPNPFYKVGTFLEDDREGFVQEVVMVGGPDEKWGPAGYRGLLHPLSIVREFTVRLQSRGLDKGAGGALL